MHAYVFDFNDEEVVEDDSDLEGPVKEEFEEDFTK